MVGEVVAVLIVEAVICELPAELDAELDPEEFDDGALVEPLEDAPEVVAEEDEEVVLDEALEVAVTVELMVN